MAIAPTSAMNAGKVEASSSPSAMSQSTESSGVARKPSSEAAV